MKIDIKTFNFYFYALNEHMKFSIIVGLISISKGLGLMAYVSGCFNMNMTNVLVAIDDNYNL